jgi:hypothetical protein
MVTENNPEIKGVAITIKGKLDINTQQYIVKMVESLCGVSINNISIIIS